MEKKLKKNFNINLVQLPGFCQHAFVSDNNLIFAETEERVQVETRYLLMLSPESCEKLGMSKVFENEEDSLRSQIEKLKNQIAKFKELADSLRPEIRYVETPGGQPFGVRVVSSVDSEHMAETIDNILNGD